jgi:hypothetical protein
MARSIRLVILLVLGALVAVAIQRMRASRSERAGLDEDAPILGSFDTWPEVPLKRSA